MLRRLAVLPLAFALSCASFEPNAGGADGGGGGGSSGGASGSSGGASGSSGGGGGGAVEVIASGLSGPLSPVVVGSSLYWIGVARDGAGTLPVLHRCDVAGCKGAPAQLLAERAFQVVSDGETVFWTGGPSVRACAAGAACDPRTVVDGLESVGVLAVHDGALYFSTGSAGSRGLVSCRASACTVGAPLWSSQSIGAVAFGGDDVYFTAGGASVELVRYRGGQAATLGALPGLPTYLAARGTNVYVVSQGQIFRCDAAAACTLVPFTTQETRVFHVVAQETGVYYSLMARGGSPGGIYRCAADDCTSPKAVLEGGNPRQMAIADGWLYFADGGDESAGNGSVRRVRL